jgi:hypothetical protein
VAARQREVGRSRNRRDGGGRCDCPCAHPAAGIVRVLMCTTCSVPVLASAV